MFLQIVHEHHKVLESCYISINCLAIHIRMHLVESNNNDDKFFLMELVGIQGCLLALMATTVLITLNLPLEDLSLMNRLSCFLFLALPNPIMREHIICLNSKQISKNEGRVAGSG